jgi:hypothetical protein
MTAGNLTSAATATAEIVIVENNADLTGPVVASVETNLLDTPCTPMTPESWVHIEELIAQDKRLQALNGAASGSSPLTEIDDVTWNRLRDALQFMLPHVGSNDLWSEAGYSLLSLQRTRPIKQLWLEWSRKAAGYTDDDAVLSWWTAHETQQPRCDFRHLLKLAREQGWRGGPRSDPSVFPIVAETAEPTPLVLQSAGNGKPLSNVNNAITVLAQQATLKVVYDEFLCKVLVQWHEDTKPRPLNDEDIIRVQWELQRMGLVQMSADSAFGAIKFVAKRNTVNCVANYLNGVAWDGTRRLSELMSRGFGTAADRYHVRAGRNMLIAMVARALRPGCQVDTAVVLEGPQGSFKSSALRIIGGDYFAELTASPNSKDFEQQLQGVWLGEFAELNALRRAEDIARIKQFVTNRTDHFRLPYGRVVVDWPRRTVLCGSTNEDCWLHDPTGGRRFIPVGVGHIDLDWLRKNRDQLFAEAVALYKAGRKWWVYPHEETLARQEARTPEDPWTEKLRNYLCGRQEISDLSELLSYVLQIPLDRQSKAHQTRVGTLLRKLGCTQQNQRRVDGKRRRPWAVPAEFASQPGVLSVPVLQFAPVAANDADAAKLGQLREQLT